MNNHNILKAWRDGEYLDSLDAEQRASLPANPADLPQVDDDILRSVTGGCGGNCTPHCDITSGLCSPCPPSPCY